MIFVYLNSVGVYLTAMRGIKLPTLVLAEESKDCPNILYVGGKEIRRVGGPVFVKKFTFYRREVSVLESEFNLVVRPVKTIQDAPSSLHGPQFDFNLLYEARGDHLWASSSWTVKDDTGKDFKLELDGKVLCLNDRESGTTTIFKEVHHAVS